MQRSRKWLLGGVLLIAVALLAVPAIVSARSDSSTAVRHGQDLDRVRSSTPAHLEHRRCVKRIERFTDPSL